MTEFFTLFAAAVFLASAGALILFLRPQTQAEPPPPVTWRVVIPRGASFNQDQAEGWFRSLIPVLHQAHVAVTVEIRSREGELQLRMTAPPALEPALRGQLAVWFPEARLARVTDESDEAVYTLPLRLTPTRDKGDKRMEGEPLLGFLGALAHRDHPCGLRVTCQRTPTGWPALLRDLHRDLRRRESESGSQATSTAGPHLLAQVELWGADADGKGAARLLELATHLAHGFAPGTVTTGKLRHAMRRVGISAPECMLSPAGIATLFHLPAAASGLFRCTESRQVPPPARVLEADSTAAEIIPGEAMTARGPIPFGLSAEERRLHTYVVGKTGTGKSTLLAHLLRQDLAAGRGVGLIDPHGDLAERVLALVPPKRYRDVLYFNPADAEYPVGFNPLAGDPAQRTLVASAVVSVFKKLFAASWGPRLEHFLRNTLLALLATPEPSLLLLPRFLTDRAFRQDRLRYVADPVLRTFFHVEYESYDPRWRAEAISPILNKVGQFLASPLLRNVVGPSAPGFDLRQIMDSGGIFIANLASGRIGEDNGALLGGLLVAQFGQAAMARASVPEAERRDFQLYVDEFQHFAGESFAQILSEARKYRLSLTLAHQFLEQLPPSLAEAVLGNVGTLCAFRLGSPDAARLQRELAPSFTASDLVHLANHHYCVRLQRQGEVLPAFSAQTVPLPAGNADFQPVIEASRQRWARPRVQVELELADLWEGRLG